MIDQAPDTTPAPAKKSAKKTSPAKQPPPCPRGDPSLGHKDPAVIQWNLTHRPDEMDAIYGKFNWRKMLAESEA